MIQRTIIHKLQCVDLMSAARGSMTDGGPWLSVLGGGCTLLVERRMQDGSGLWTENRASTVNLQRQNLTRLRHN